MILYLNGLTFKVLISDLKIVYVHSKGRYTHNNPSISVPQEMGWEFKPIHPGAGTTTGWSLAISLTAYEYVQCFLIL